MMVNHTRVAKLGAFAAVLSLAVPGPADAHVMGRMELTGSAGGTSIAEGGGIIKAIDDCPFFADGYPRGDALAPANGGAITINVSRTSGGGPPDCRQLQSGVNEVAFHGGAHFVRDGQGGWVSNGGDYPAGCRGGSYGSGAVVIGTIQVDNRGNGAGSFSLPDNLPVNGPNDAAVVCVYHPTNSGFRANFAPVIIVG